MWCNVGTAKTILILGGTGNIFSKDENSIILGRTVSGNWWTLYSQSDEDENLNHSIAAKHCATYQKFAFEAGPTTAGLGSDDDLYKGKYGTEYLCSRNKLERHPKTGHKLVIVYSDGSPTIPTWNNFDPNSEFYKSRQKIKEIEMSSMIDKAKGTCKELGFEEGTEKFADCALKLYSQSVELAAKNNQQVVMQPQSSGSNSVTIYDPVRDYNALMKKSQRMLSGACTLGIDC